MFMNIEIPEKIEFMIEKKYGKITDWKKKITIRIEYVEKSGRSLFNLSTFRIMEKKSTTKYCSSLARDATLLYYMSVTKINLTVRIPSNRMKQKTRWCAYDGLLIDIFIHCKLTNHFISKFVVQFVNTQQRYWKPCEYSHSPIEIHVPFVFFFFFWERIAHTAEKAILWYCYSAQMFASNVIQSGAHHTWTNMIQGEHRDGTTPIQTHSLLWFTIVQTAILRYVRLLCVMFTVNVSVTPNVVCINAHHQLWIIFYSMP